MATIYGFAYSEKALTFLEALPTKLSRQIVKKIDALAREPFPPSHKLVQGMSQNGVRVHRIRSGDYRVLYIVKDVTVIILDIDHRKDVYR